MDLDTLKTIPTWEWPLDAGRIILDALQNDRADASDRFLAVELAGSSGEVDNELAEALLSILKSTNDPETLRKRAAISLGFALEYAFMDGFDARDDEMITESMFRNIQETLHRLYRDARIPREVRRRVLEASVRAPENWHKEAVRASYRSNEEDWKLTAVFCMQYIGGSEKEILESIGSQNPDIHYEAIWAAGNWEIDAAWLHITALISLDQTDKDLLFAAIEAAILIRPDEAVEILYPLLDSDDQDIVDAADEALAMIGGRWDEGYEENDEGDDDDDRILH